MLVPQPPRIGDVVVNQQAGKKLPQASRQLHANSFWKALVPFSIILQQAMCKACNFKSGVHNCGRRVGPVGSSKVLKACGPCNLGKQNSQIITLTLWGLDKIHAPHNSQCDMIVSACTLPPRCPFPEVPRLFGFIPHGDFEIIRVQCGQRSRQWRCRVVAVANQNGYNHVFIFGLSVKVTPLSQSGGVVTHHGFPNRGPFKKVSGLLIRQMNS